MCNHNYTPFNNKEKHDEEHEKWSRRSFLQALGLAGSGSMLLGGNILSASAPSPLTSALNASENDNILILIRLTGGNDGLNTIIPAYDFDTYANFRPKIHIPFNNLTRLNDAFYMPKYMENLEKLWGDGGMKVVHGVGYENHNLSHFSSSDIFASTDVNNQTRTGWMGRYFDNHGDFSNYLLNPPSDPAAIQVGNIGNLIFQGDDVNYAFTINNVTELERIAEEGVVHSLLDLMPDCTYEEQLYFLRGAANTTYEYAGVISEKFKAASNSVEFPNGSLGRQLATVSRLIKGGLGTKIYMVSLGGFDTHSAQPERHQRLMTEVADAVDAFYQDLEAGGHHKRVLSMTFSEFGRRVYENGSFGTDHGTSAPMLLFGPGIEGQGFIGEHPDLNDLIRGGNLKNSVDFRDVYASVMSEWLCIDNNLVSAALNGQTASLLGLGLTCSSVDNTVIEGQGPIVDGSDPMPDIIEPDMPEFENATTFEHFPSYGEDKNVYVNYTVPTAAHLVIKLYNILGQDLGTIVNEMSFEGQHKVNITEAAKKTFNRGHYIYSISYNGKSYSKSIVLS
ncbi:DUF1501 domain-containing protein [Galbibacter mesophilus]|uniref:DUF1501 domain-containing protein n=1 Tax=Galbibacter mesophilus TaxID=379069 RepID=UPI00191DC2F1|nr:DUF1501 domain-containing protein [Galbibacter mesophilus]MCM5662006.1 DUF1501 domain-containing protein [Galbibacter mesophilus]